ncbi:hypothetical protein [Vagococcus sp. WN89Y]|uniref:hypothetical protein n=1 Tax=Vagococcus sp. WN89Y TaxID=3457258 RepID=UPI003FCDE505
MKRSDLEKDAAFILTSMSERDYEIPSNKKILKVIFSWLKYAYGLQVIFVLLAYFIYREPGGLNYQIQKIAFLIFLSAPLMFVFTLVFIGATYSNVCISMILGDDIKNESILLKIFMRKIRFYSRLLLIVNSLIGCILLWVGEPFIAGLGISWFVTFLMSILFLQGSLSRYMTPAVVSSLSKVKDLLSASPI